MSRRVVVLGAGLAGLAAAYALVRRGFAVTVLEAREVAGGRVRTIRAPFLEGGYAEAGAVRIRDGQQHTHKYIAELGLRDRLFDYHEPGQRLWYLDGQRFTSTGSVGAWPAGMTEAERADPFGRFEAYLGAAVAAAGDVRAPGWPSPELADLDGLTLNQLARRRVASDAWLRFLRAAEGNLGGVNALAFVGQQAWSGGAGGSVGLRGGNDQLPRALAESLGDRVHYRAVVCSVDSRPDRVVVGYRNRGGGRRELTADRVVCAIPFPVLRRGVDRPVRAKDEGH